MKKHIFIILLSIILCSSVFGFLGISFFDPGDVQSRIYTINCTSGCDFGNVTNINVTNITIINGTFINQFDQVLNTTSNVTFDSIFTTGNITINNNSVNNILSTVYNINGCTSDTFGTFCYDSTYDTMRFVTDSGQILQMNQETTMPGKNLEGSIVTDGSIVYLMGATGANPNFKLAKADQLNTSGLLGVVTKDCNNNQVCPVVFFALVHGYNTSNYNAGDHLYLSDTQAGIFTTTPPLFPNVPIWVATVIRVHEIEGTIFVFPRLDSANGITMNTLGLVGDFIQTDYKISSLPGNAAIGQNVFTIQMNGTSGIEVPHLVLQPGGAGQASIWTRSGITVPEIVSCLNTINRTEPNCYASIGGYTWDLLDFNTNLANGADWGITGELEVIKDANIQGNLTIGNSLFYQNWTLKETTGHINLLGVPYLGAYVTRINGATQNVPHAVFSPGGVNMTSVIVRSLLIANEVNNCLNNTDATDAFCYAREGGFNWSIDFATSITGADLGITDDIEWIGDAYGPDTDGEVHFLTREFELVDENRDETLVVRINTSIIGSTFNITEYEGESLIVNIGEVNYDLGRSSEEISLTSGTNATPVFNHIYYNNAPTPVLVKSTTDQEDKTNVFKGVFGANTFDYGSFVDNAHQYELTRGTYERFFDEGSIYLSGFNINASSTNTNFTIGAMKIIIDKEDTTQAHDTNIFYSHIHQDGTFHQHSNLNGLDEYASGEAIGNNKYFNVVCGIAHTQDDTGIMYCVPQNKPVTEYTRVIDAEVDISNTLQFFPNDDFIKKIYIPIARYVMKISGGTVTIQTLTNGELWFDVRGTATTSSGSSPSPGITSHPDLINLNWASAGHTIDTTLDMNSNNIININDITLSNVLTTGSITLPGVLSPDLDVTITDDDAGKMILTAPDKVSIQTILEVGTAVVDGGAGYFAFSDKLDLQANDIDNVRILDVDDVDVNDGLTVYGLTNLQGGLLVTDVDNTRVNGSINLTDISGTTTVYLTGLSGEDIFFNNGGNVGIGKSNPGGSYSLDVAGNVNFDGFVTLDNQITTSGATPISQLTETDTGSDYRVLVAGNVTYLQAGDTAISDSRMDWRVTSMFAATTHLGIKGSTGYVGIGTGNPASRLDIIGDDLVLTIGDSSFNDKYWSLRSGEAGSGYFGLDISANSGNGAYVLQAGTTKDLYFSVNSDTKFQLPAMFIDDLTENVQIGTTSAITYPDNKLVVADGTTNGRSFMTITNNNVNQFLKLGQNINVGEFGVDQADTMAWGHYDTTADTTLTARATMDTAGDFTFNTDVTISGDLIKQRQVIWCDGNQGTEDIGTECCSVYAQTTCTQTEASGTQQNCGYNWGGTNYISYCD